MLTINANHQESTPCQFNTNYNRKGLISYCECIRFISTSPMVSIAHLLFQNPSSNLLGDSDQIPLKSYQNQKTNHMLPIYNATESAFPFLKRMEDKKDTLSQSKIKQGKTWVPQLHLWDLRHTEWTRGLRRHTPPGGLCVPKPHGLSWVDSTNCLHFFSAAVPYPWHLQHYWGFLCSLNLTITVSRIADSGTTDIAWPPGPFSEIWVRASLTI